MSDQEMRDLCTRLAAEIVERLRISNEAWDNFHGVAHRFTPEDYAEATEEVFEVLYRHAGYGVLDPGQRL